MTQFVQVQCGDEVIEIPQEEVCVPYSHHMTRFVDFSLSLGIESAFL
jgi:hypothetical protein